MSGPTRSLAFTAAGFTFGLLWPWPHPGFWPLLGISFLLLLLLIVHLIRRRTTHGVWFHLMLLLWFSLGLLRVAPATTSLPDGRLWVRGTVVAPVETRPESTRLRIDVERWRQGKRSGQLAIRAVTTIRGRVSLQPGDTVQMIGELVPLSGPRNPGDFDEQSYWGLRGVEARLIQTARLEGLGVHGIRAHLSRLLGDLRSSVRERLATHLDTDQLPLAEALMLGDRSGWEEGRRDRLARSGLMHLFAISGLHAGIIAAILYAFFSLLTLPRGAVQALILVLLWIYVPFTGGNPPVLRAVVMISLFLVGSLFHRQNRIGYALLLAWIGLLAWRPEGIHDAGFQLTFAGTFGSLYAGMVFKDLTRPGKLLYLSKHIRGPRKLQRSITYALLISIGAAAATAPIVIFQFGRLPWFGPLVTLLALPLISGVILSGWLSLLLGVIPLLGNLFGNTMWALLSLLEGIAGASADWLPVSEHLSLHAALLSLVTVVILFWFAPKLRQRPLRGLLFTMLLVANAVTWSFNWQPDNRLMFAAFDVGQGDGLLLRRGDRAVVVDGGRERSPAMLRQLRLLGIRRIELLILTHGDADHAGSAAEIIRTIPVRAALIGPGLWRDASGRSALQALSNSRVPTFIGARGDHVSLGDLGKVDLLGPPPDVLHSLSATDNELSLVTLWQGDGVTMLFPGDAGSTIEQELVASGDLPKVDLLVAGHHGSRSSTGNAWLQTLAPEWVVISAGRNNPYGHPSLQTLARLQRTKAKIHRTDRSGAALFSIREECLHFLRHSEWW